MQQYTTLDKEWKVTVKYGTWDHFTQQFGIFFGGSQDKEEAAAELTKFRQGQMDINEYTSKFRELVGRSGIKEELVLIRYVKESIKPALRDRLNLIHPQPSTHEEFLNKARLLQSEWEINQTFTN